MKKFLLLLSLLTLMLVLVSCGTNSLSEYQIVIPENATLTETYAAENLSELIKENYGVAVNIVKDNEEKKNNEILIGETNRKESKTDTQLDKMQYLLFKKGDKIVIKGDGIYVGAGCGKLANEHLTLEDEDILITNLEGKETVYNYTASTQCDNVIFMIGDGMGDNHILLGEDKHNFTFVARQFPNIGTSITRSQSVLDKEASYTDSAASATAMATGFKTLNGYVGVDKNGNKLLNVRELAQSMKAKTAILTTDEITGATPAAYLCHCISREDTKKLQNQIDGLLFEKKVDYCKGKVDNDLTKETKIALNSVSKGKSKFFVMIEEAYIDKNSHNKDLESTAYTVSRFNDAIEYATQFALMHPNTALIVTADHETGKLAKTSIFKEGFGFMSDEHSHKDVPVFAIGPKTEYFNDKRVENVELGKFVASFYTDKEFGMDLDDLKAS